MHKTLQYFIILPVYAWKACKANIAYTQYTLALAIQILKLLLKLDIVSKPKPQNNHKCPMEATQII